MALPYWRLSAYYFFYFAFVGAFSPYFGLYLSSIGFTAADIAIVMSLMQVMRILAPSLWGWLADRIGARTPIIRAAGAASLGGFLIFFSTEQFIGVFVAMALMSFFWSASLPLVEALTLEHLKSRVSRYGAVRVWGSIGFVVTVLVLGDLLERTDLGLVLWACSVLLAGIFLCSLSVPEAPVHAERAVATQSLRDILRSGPVAGLFGAAFFMSCAHGALYVFYSIHLDEHGYSKRLIGGLWTLGVLAEIGVFLCMPLLLRRFTLRAVLMAALLAASIRFIVIGWAVASPAWLVGAQLLHGLTFGAFHASSVAALNQWFDARQQARAQALYGSVSFGAGGMVGGLLSGWMWAPLGGAWAFAVSSLFALAGYLLLRRLWRADTLTAQG
ncbi:MAG: MFS transporter [Methyloversatilis sp.]|jgi:PPP family 3-phenylpropionic acid transporter|nr:MFS transporter [Methyloversatilis sp.]MBP6194190.1 MFS transporter [Methyloversatilis sp.]MBP9117387.1 MFS transporter [Methyloversatilis sp.]